MVEPLAGSIWNSLRPTRLSFKASSSSFTRAINNASSKTPTLASNFFTPTPRDVKGKGRATSDDVSDCRKWACFESRHSIWCSENTRTLLLGELAYMSKHRPMTRIPTNSTRSPRFRVRTIQRQMPKDTLLGQRRRVSSAIQRVLPSFTATQSELPDDAHWAEGKEKLASLHALLTGEVPLVPSMEKEAEFDHVFLELYHQDVFSQIPGRLVLLVVKQLLFHLDRLLLRFDVDQAVLQKWASRLEELMDLPETRTASSKDFDHPCVMTRILAMKGDIVGAKAYLAQREPRGVKYRGAATAVMLSLAYYEDLSSALEYGQLENAVLTKCSSNDYRKIVHRLITAHPHLPHLPAQVRDWDTRDAKPILNYVMEVTRKHGMYWDSISLIEELASRKIPPHDALLIKYGQELINLDNFSCAERVFACVSTRRQTSTFFKSLSLLVSSHLGQVKRSEAFYDDLRNSHSLSPNDTANLLYAYRNERSLDDLQKCFERCFPMGPTRHRRHTPNVYHYSIIIQAFARVGDIEGINRWLEDMKANNVELNEYIYMHIVESFARRGDLVGLTETMDQMRSQPEQSRRYAYTSVISFLGGQADSKAVDAILERACNEGIEPDLPMLRAVMNAYVDSGNWRGVVRVYGELTSMTIKPSIDVYNVVLKALVHLATPFPIVAQYVRRLEDEGLEPDKYTYASLMQSAVDSRLLGPPLSILYQLISKRERQPHLLDVNHFTIVISALLRWGDKTRAKTIFDEMLACGIQPTTVTYRAILNSFDQTANSFEEAKELVNNLLSQSTDRPSLLKQPKGERHPLVGFYSPLIRSAVWRQQIGLAETYYRKYLGNGGTPSLTLLTLLLDGYRRRNYMTGFRRIWERILELAQPRPLMKDREGRVTTTKIRDIQAPMSMYINMMSRYGEHERIADQWRALSDQGMMFDSHNWNHLALALIRAGKVYQAFEVAEQVIIPFRDLSIYSSSGHDEEGQPTFTSSYPPSEQAIDDPLDPILRPPIRFGYRRRSAARYFLLSLRGNSRKWNFASMLHPPTLLYPLQLMHTLRPHWNIWRLNKAVVQAFLTTFIELQRGYVVVPTTQERPEITYVSDPTHAFELLAQVQAKCPKLFAFLVKQQRRLKHKLGRKYEKRFIWH